MGTLTIRNLDDRVIQALKSQARGNQRSLSAEVRVLLSRHTDRNQAMKRFRERTARLLEKQDKIWEPDSVALLREERDR